MNKQFKVILTAAVSAVLAHTGRSSLITGSLGFSGSVSLDNTSVLTSTATLPFNDTAAINGYVGVTSSNFTSIASSTAITFSQDAWDFNTTVPITNFLSVGGFQFELQSSQIADEGVAFSGYGYLNIKGTGVISGNGYTPTLCNFSFSTLDPFAGYGPLLYTYSCIVYTTGTNGEPVLVNAPTTNGIVLS